MGIITLPKLIAWWSGLMSYMIVSKCCTQYASKFGRLSSGHRTGKSVFIPIPKKDNAKECSNYHTITLFTHTSNLMFKILQASLQQYMHWELPDVQARFRKGRRTRDQIAKVHWITEKARDYQTTLLTAWEICMQVKEQYLEQDMEQWTGFKLGKEYVKAVYITLLI